MSAIESIVVYNLFHWKTFCAEREARKLSWAKYKKRLNEWRHYNTFRERDIERDARREEYGGDSFADAVDGVAVADKATDGADGAYEINEVNGSTSAPRGNIGFGLLRLRKGEKTSEEGGTKDDRALSRCDSPGKPTVASILREDGDYGKALAVGNPFDPRALARHDSHSRYALRSFASGMWTSGPLRSKQSATPLPSRLSSPRKAATFPCFRQTRWKARRWTEKCKCAAVIGVDRHPLCLSSRYARATRSPMTAPPLRPPSRGWAGRPVDASGACRPRDVNDSSTRRLVDSSTRAAVECIGTRLRGIRDRPISKPETMQIALCRSLATLPRAERGMLQAAGILHHAVWRDESRYRPSRDVAPTLSPNHRPNPRPSTPGRGRAAARDTGDAGNTGDAGVAERPSAIIGRVMAAQANFVRIKVERTGGGEPFADSSPPPQTRLLCVVRALLKKMKRQVLVGDVVRVVGIDWVDGRGMVEDVFPRSSKLDEPPVANISRVMLVFSLAMPPFMPSAATRYLVSAEHTGLPVTVVLNKCDLVSDGEVREEVRRLEAWGYDCVAVSVQEGREIGLEALEERLKGDVTVVAGPSGAGKSSIINALSLRSTSLASSSTTSTPKRHLRDDEVESEGCEGEGKGEGDDARYGTGEDAVDARIDLQAVGDVSERAGRGKHTTRNVTIIELAGGGALVDTPGFNQPTLSFPATELEACFPEIRARLDRLDNDGNDGNDGNEGRTCAFKNCRHVSEPGCVVRGAATEDLGDDRDATTDAIPWERYPYYVELLEELQATEDHLAKRAIAKRRREGTTRKKKSAGGVDRVEARLDTKSHRRTSRRSVRQEISVLNPEDAEDYDGSFEIK